MSYSRHAYNSYGNPYYTGVTVPYPGYPYDASFAPVLTVADLDLYFENSLNSDAWNALSPLTKEQALAEAQRWLATLCWNMQECCGRNYQDAYLMAAAELALALAQAPTAVIGNQPQDGRWVEREKLDVLEVQYGLLGPTTGGIASPGSGYPILLQRFPWLKDIIGCWLEVGPRRQIRLYRN